MGIFRQMLMRLRMLLVRRRFDDELSEEMRLHLDMIIEEHVASGMSKREARNKAMRRFGNRTVMEERSREVWTYRTLSSLLQDLHYGLRMMRRAPVFTIVAVASLALGIGANTAIFSVVDALILKMLPVRDPGQLLRLELADYKINDFDIDAFSYPAYIRLRDNNQVFDGLVAIGAAARLDIVLPGPAGAGQSVLMDVTLVSGNYFSVLGVRPILGRSIAPDDDKAGAGQPVAMLSYRCWSRQLGLDPNVIGKTIVIGKTDFTVVGITPPAFFGTSVGSYIDIFVPMAMAPTLGHLTNVTTTGPGNSPLESFNSFWLSLVGRLRPGVSPIGASANVNVVYQQVLDERASEINNAEAREAYLRQHVTLEPGGRGESSLRETFSKPLLILLGIVGLVLLIACANIANLMLARGAARRKELSVRLALGAGRFRLIRQLLTESLMIAILGAVAGLALAQWGSIWLVAMVSTGRDPILLNTGVDVRALGFTGGVALLTALFFGLAPALRSTNISLASGLNNRTSNPVRSALGKALVAGQVALCLLLLIGAGVFIHSLQNLRTIDIGFDRQSVYQVSWDAVATGYNNARMANVFDSVRQRVAGLPGVSSASVSQTGLFSMGWIGQPIFVDGKPGSNEWERIDRVDPNFFETVGMRIVRGRSFNSQDTANSPKVAIINETLMRRYFDGADPTGKRIYMDAERQDAYEIVGLVKDAKYTEVREPSLCMVYLPYLQGWQEGNLKSFNQLEVRAIGNTAGLPATLRAEIHSIDPDLKVQEVSRLSDLIDASLVQERAIAKLSGFFGLLALLLASIGLYGIMSYSVSQRTAEVGIRLALGAAPSRVQWLILRETLLLLAIGIAIGVPVAIAANKLVSTLVYGLSGPDPWAIGLATLLLTAASVLAGYLPARSAARVDPMVALRYE
jgi:predicted permease